MKLKTCRVCSKEFEVFPYQEKSAFYCSIPCSRVGQWKYHKKTMLEHLKISQPLAAKSRTGIKLSRKIKKQRANKNGNYKRIIEDWIRLCASCHMKYDIKNNLRTRKKVYGLKR